MEWENHKREDHIAKLSIPWGSERRGLSTAGAVSGFHWNKGPGRISFRGPEPTPESIAPRWPVHCSVQCGRLNVMPNGRIGQTADARRATCRDVDADVLPRCERRRCNYYPV